MSDFLLFPFFLTNLTDDTLITVYVSKIIFLFRFKKNILNISTKMSINFVMVFLLALILGWYFLLYKLFYSIIITLFIFLIKQTSNQHTA